jgi:hypothetical protein
MTQQPNFAINIVRLLTKLKNLFINFYADPTAGAQTNAVNIKAGGEDAAGVSLGNDNMDFVF